jgi:hypothetical protein
MIKVHALFLLAAILSNAFAVTKANFKFVDYPDMANPNSSWGSICYSTATNKVIIGVTDHVSQVGIFEWDCSKKTMSRRNWVSQGGHLQWFQWQGKIHSQMVENRKDGWVYFGTDGGEGREEYYMDHANGYFGGFFMKYNPATFEIINLGNGRRYESIKEIGIDQVRQRLYGITYPATHFLIKDLATDSLIDKGSLNKAHVGRTLFTDDWGNAYYTDMRGGLIKYEPAADTLLWADDLLARDTAVTSVTAVRSGLRAWTRVPKTNEYFFITTWSRIFKLTAREKGLGKVEDLGHILEPTKDIKLKDIVGVNCPNMAFHPNKKLYFIAGGHGNYIKDDSTLVIEVDPALRTKKIIYAVSTDVISEATGSNVVDREGNLYFAARREGAVKSVGETIRGSAELIIFNPEKEIGK